MSQHRFMGPKVGVLLASCLLATCIPNSRAQDSRSAEPPAPGSRPAGSAADHAEIGRPFITNYHPTEYGASTQNWAILQDDRGVIYVGNNAGVLEYDGSTWRLIESPNRTTIRSMAKAPDGRIFAGAVGELGYLEADSAGQMQFVSLRDRLPEENLDFSDIWQISVIDDAVYFTTTEYIFRWNGRSMRVWPAETPFHLSASVDGTLYVRQWEVGLMRLEGDELKLVPGGEQFTQERVYVMLPFGDGRILIGTRTQGLFLFDGARFTPFRTEADALLTETGLYLPGAVLPGGRFALGTFSEGVIIIDREGRLLRHLDRTTGLQDNVILYTYVDKDGALWLGLDNGISRIEIDAPVSYFGAADGLTSTVLSLERHQGDLYAGTSTGLVRLDRSTRQLKEISGAGTQVFDLLSVEGDLLIASFDGLQLLDGETTRFVQRAASGSHIANRLHRSHQHPDRVFVSSAGTGLKVIRRETAGRWIVEGTVPGTNYEFWSIAEAKPGTLWLGTSASGVLRVRFPGMDDNRLIETAEVTAYGADHGLPLSSVQIAAFGQHLVFLTKEGFFRFDEEAERFVPDSTTFAEVRTGGDPEEWTVMEDEEGRLWLNLGRETAVAYPQPDGSYDVDTGPFRRFSGTASAAIHPEASGAVWLGYMDRLVRLDLGQSSAEDVSFPALLRRVATIEGRTVFGGTGEMTRQALPYDDRALRFEYAAPRYVESGRTEYQVMLDGFDAHPSAWTRQAAKEYTNLPPGDYTFRVRARDVNGLEGREAAYAFTILAPWYRAPWAILLYILIAGALVYLLVRARTKHLEARGRELEETVHLRTIELEQRVEELAVINSVQQGLVAALDIEEIYGLVGDRIREIFDAQSVIIATFNHEDNVEQFRYCIEKGERIFPPPRPLDPVRRSIVRTREPILIEKDFIDAIVAYGAERLHPVPGTEMPRSAVFVPMVVGDRVKGYVSLQNVDREYAFDGADVRLLTTLTNSMSVALENARLFAETTRLLAETEQRSAELAVINGVQEGLVAELDMQAIYDLVGDRIRDLFDAQVVVIRTFDHDKCATHIRYAVEKGQRFYEDPQPADTFDQHLMKTREPILINEDFMGYIRRFDPDREILWGEAPRSALFVPMVVGDFVRGNVSLQNVDTENAFDEADVRLLTTLTNSMSVALENARLFAETTRRATELDTVNRISRALVAQLDFDSLVRLVGEQMRDTFRADIVYVALLDRDDQIIRFPYVHGDDLSPISLGEGLTSRIIITREPLLINEDVTGSYEQLGLEEVGTSAASYLGVPILVGDEAIGVISVQSTTEQDRFGADDLRLLSTIAANVGVALQNAEAYRHLAEALRELKAAQQQLVHQEKLASLGALTAGIAHEIKNPLNFVNNFAALSMELVDEIAGVLRQNPEEAEAILADLRINAAKIEEHGRRADGIVRSMLEHSRGTKGERRRVDINALVEEYVGLAYHGKRAQAFDFNVTLDRDYDKAIGEVEVVPQDIGRVLINLLGNAFDAIEEHARRTNGQYEPTVRVATRRRGNVIQIRIEDNGPGIPEEVRERIFEPFFTTKPSGSGTGLGLSMSHEIVTQGHGGSLTVDNADDSGAAFTITLPVTPAMAEV